MSINNLTKDEIIDQLQIVEYHHDEMFTTLQKIYGLFDMNINLDHVPDGFSIDNPEHLGDYVYAKLCEIKNQLKS